MMGIDRGELDDGRMMWKKSRPDIRTPAWRMRRIWFAIWVWGMLTVVGEVVRVDCDGSGGPAMVAKG